MAPSPRDDRMSQRLSEGLDGVSKRIDTGFASVREAFDDLAEHVRRVEARTNAKVEDLDKTVTREFGQLEIGIGELRDRVARLEGSPAAAAKIAQAVAETAQTTAATVVATARTTARDVAHGFMGTWVGRLIAGCTAFTTIVIGISNIPSFVRGWNALWHFLGSGK